MAEGFETGAGIAWRLLATLEGGTLLLATSALLAYTTRRKLIRRKRKFRPIRNVLMTNTTSILGRELKQRLEDRGCSVRTSDEDKIEGEDKKEGENKKEGEDKKEGENKIEGEDKIDCLIIIGADYKDGLDGISQLVTEDVYNNIHLLESLSPSVRGGGRLVWVCGAGRGHSGAYCGAAAAFRALTRAALTHVAKLCHCEPLWVDGCDSTVKTVENVLVELFPCTTHHGFSFRNAAHKIRKYLYGWMNVIT